MQIKIDNAIDYYIAPCHINMNLMHETKINQLLKSQIINNAIDWLLISIYEN